MTDAKSFKNKDAGLPFYAKGVPITVPFNEYEDWHIAGSCSIVSSQWLRAWMDVRKNDEPFNVSPWVWALTSGDFDCIHPGHISCFQDGINKVIDRNPHVLCSLIVVVNGDEFLRRKKGKPFMPLKVRCQVISSMRRVDYVVPFNATDPEDMGVGEAIKLIRPTYFLKGGDRSNAQNIPEWGICKDIGTEIITGCGDAKLWSSSNFLKEWKHTNCIDCGRITHPARRCLECRCK